MRASRRHTITRIGLVATVVVLVLVLGPIVSAPEPELSVADDPAALHPWRLVGCWELRYGGWGGVEVPASERPAGEEGAPTGALTPPRTLMLLPDSVDEWGRVLPSYRAVPLREDEHRPGRSLRWMVRDDTLWVLWSEGRARAGAALHRSGDSLVGSVRALEGRADEDSLDLNASAAAVEISCASGERLPGSARPAR